jgi:hypothetical protein
MGRSIDVGHVHLDLLNSFAESFQVSSDCARPSGIPRGQNIEVAGTPEVQLEFDRVLLRRDIGEARPAVGSMDSQEGLRFDGNANHEGNPLPILFCGGRGGCEAEELRIANPVVRLSEAAIEGPSAKQAGGGGPLGRIGIGEFEDRSSDVGHLLGRDYSEFCGGWKAFTLERATNSMWPGRTVTGTSQSGCASPTTAATSSVLIQ